MRKYKIIADNIANHFWFCDFVYDVPLVHKFDHIYLQWHKYKHCVVHILQAKNAVKNFILIPIFINCSTFKDLLNHKK